MANQNKLSRLGQALEAFLERRASGGIEPEHDFLSRHEELRDLLEPMLRERDDTELPNEDPVEEGAPIGEQLGDYRIVRLIGRGAMGLVYEAQQISLGRRVALKVLPSAATMNPQAVARFYRESALVARLQHPAIVEVLGVGRDHGCHFYAMELVQGVSLAAVLEGMRKEGIDRPDGSCLSRVASRLSSSDTSVGLGGQPDGGGATTGDNRSSYCGTAVRMFVMLAEALHHAHETGVLHRDVKPSNILIRHDGTPVLMDFGLAREEGLPSMTLTGEFAGTPYYVSPEQALGRTGDLDRRTDLFSLGVTMYEVLTLRRPFEAESSHEVLQRILTREPPNPRRLYRGISPDLAAIVLRCLEKDPGKRYSTAAELAGDLRSYLELRPVSARHASTWERVARWTRREPLKTAVVVLVALGAPLITGLGGYVLAVQEEIVTGEELLLDREMDELLQLAFVFMESDEQDRALQLFDEVLVRDPEEPIAVAGKVFVLCGQKRTGEARALFERLPAPVRTSRAVTRSRAYVMSRSGRHEDAERLRAELGPPRGPVECLVAAMELIEEGHGSGDDPCFRRARDLLLRAALESPRPHLLVHEQLAHALGHLGDVDHCRIVARALEINWPESPPSWFWSSFAVHRFDRSWRERSLQRAIDLAPESHFFVYNMGTDLLQWGRAEEALPFLERAARLDEGDARTLNNLGACYSSLGRPEDALRVVRRAADSNPDDPLHRVNVGNALSSMGRVDEARVEYRRALDMRPDYVLAWYEFAITLYRHRKLEEFEEIVEEAKTKVSDDPRIHNLVGRLAMLRRDAPAARAAFEAALAADQEDAEAHAWLSRALRHDGDPEGALAHAERAAKLEPIHERLVELAGVQQANGKLQAALATLAAAEAEEPDQVGVILAQARIVERLGRDRQEADAHRKRAAAVAERVFDAGDPERAIRIAEQVLADFEGVGEDGSLRVSLEGLLEKCRQSLRKTR